MGSFTDDVAVNTTSDVAQRIAARIEMGEPGFVLDDSLYLSVHILKNGFIVNLDGRDGRVLTNDDLADLRGGIALAGYREGDAWQAWQGQTLLHRAMRAGVSVRLKKPEPLYTFVVDGEVYFEHGTFDACIDLIEQRRDNGDPPVAYEIRPYVAEES